MNIWFCFRDPFPFYRFPFFFSFLAVLGGRIAMIASWMPVGVRSQ